MCDSGSLTFTCTDTANNKKVIKYSLEGGQSQKDYTRNLIDKIKEFQVEVNSVMNVLVDNEKAIKAAKNGTDKASDGLKSKKPLKEDEETGEDDANFDEPSEDDAEDPESKRISELAQSLQQNAKRAQRKSNEAPAKEPEEKRLCLDGTKHE